MREYKKPVPQYKGLVQKRHQFCIRGAIYISFADDELDVMQEEIKKAIAAREAKYDLHF